MPSPRQVRNTRSAISPRLATRSFLTDADRRLGDDARGSASDAPAHFGPGRETVDELPLERLVVPAVRLDVRALVGGNPGFTLSSEHVEELERAEGRVPAGTALL